MSCLIKVFKVETKRSSLSKTYTIRRIYNQIKCTERGFKRIKLWAFIITSGPGTELTLSVLSFRCWHRHKPSCWGGRRCRPACPWDRWIRPGRQRHTRRFTEIPPFGIAETKTDTCWRDEHYSFSSSCPGFPLRIQQNKKYSKTVFDGGLLAAEMKVQKFWLVGCILLVLYPSKVSFSLLTSTEHGGHSAALTCQAAYQGDISDGSWNLSVAQTLLLKECWKYKLTDGL